MDNEPRLPLKARVRLRDGLDPSLYSGMAKVGNEGWITARRNDRFGLPEVYIHWDPYHWAYNYQPDCWTYEEHFDIVEGDMADNKDIRKQLGELAANFADQLASAIEANDTSTVPEAIQEEILDEGRDVQEFASDEQYAESVAKVMDALNGSDAFLLVAVKREAHPMAKDGLIKPRIVADAKSADSQLLVGMQAASVAASYHADAGIALIEVRGDGSAPVQG